MPSGSDDYKKEIFGWFYQDPGFNNEKSYVALLSHLRDQNVIPFIGAGFSYWAGYPTWKKLLTEMANECDNKETIIDLIEEEKFTDAADEITDRKGGFEFIKEQIKEKFREEQMESKKDKRPDYQYDFISMFSEVPILTTNYDLCIEDLYRRKFNGQSEIKVFVPIGSNSDEVRGLIRDGGPCLLKLHGTVEEPGDVVLTTGSYNIAYCDDFGNVDLRKPMPKALSTCLNSKYVLFIGSSLDKDRTMDIIKDCASKESFFAIAEMEQFDRFDERDIKNQNKYENLCKKDFIRRNKELSEYGISVIWYPKGKHDECIGKIISQLQKDLDLKPIINSNGIKTDSVLNGEKKQSIDQYEIMGIRLSHIEDELGDMKNMIDQLLVICKNGFDKNDNLVDDSQIEVEDSDFNIEFNRLLEIIREGSHFTSDQDKKILDNVMKLVKDRNKVYLVTDRLKLQNERHILGQLITDNDLMYKLYHVFGINEYELGRYIDSIDDLSKALNYSEDKKLDDLTIAQYYYDIGKSYSGKGDLINSKFYFAKALGIREKVLPPNHPDLATSYNSIGVTYSNLGDNEKALEYKMKALGIREKVLPPNHPDLATSYNSIGVTYHNLGDNEKALGYYMRALDIREKDHPDLATSYNNIGVTYGDLGDNKKALEYKMKALDIREKVLPLDHPYIATSYDNIGITHNDLGDYKKALEYKMKALDIREKVLPPNHPDLATSYNSIGVTYCNRGDNEKALGYYMRALDIREKVLPSDHSDLATSYNNIGVTYGDLGDNKKALEYKMKALDIREKALPLNHPYIATSYDNIGTTYSDLGDYKKALEYKMKALDIREKALLPNHPDLATSYNSIGVTYRNLGDNEKALEYMMKALDIYERALPSNHPDLATSYNSIGVTYRNLGDNEKALEYMMKALDIRERVLPSNHPDLASSYNNIGVTYGDLGNHNKEKEYIDKVKKFDWNAY